MSTKVFILRYNQKYTDDSHFLVRFGIYYEDYPDFSYCNEMVVNRRDGFPSAIVIASSAISCFYNRIDSKDKLIVVDTDFHHKIVVSLRYLSVVPNPIPKIITGEELISYIQDPRYMRNVSFELKNLLLSTVTGRNLEFISDPSSPGSVNAWRISRGLPLKDI